MAVSVILFSLHTWSGGFHPELLPTTNVPSDLNNAVFVIVVLPRYTLIDFTVPLVSGESTVPLATPPVILPSVPPTVSYPKFNPAACLIG